MDNQQASQNKRKYVKHNGDIHHPEFPHKSFAGYKAGCKCIECVLAYREYKRVYTKNLRATSKKYLLSQRNNKREYRKTETGRIAYRNSSAKRRIRENVAILSKEEKELLLFIYKNCPEGYQVDHIIPISLNGQHIPNNLQYLPKEVNLRKSNSLNYNCEKESISWQSLILKASTTNK